MYHNYPYTDFHEANMDWFLNKFKSLLTEWEDMKVEFDNLQEAFEALQAYVNDYFDNLDVQEEINNKLEAMAADGSLGVVLDPYVKTYTEGWLAEHITQETGYVLDDTLTIQGAAADAEAVGLKAFLFRGEISTLGITDLTQCKGPGYYRFKTSDIPNINVPAGVTQAGFILAMPNTSTSRWQLLISNTAQYFRYNADNVPATWRPLPTTDSTLSVSGKSADAGAVNTRALLNRGNIILAGYTDLNDCIDTGYYSWYTDNIESIANMPPDIDTGGFMLTFNTLDDNRWQLLFNIHKIYVRYNTTSWHLLNNSGNTKLNKVRWYVDGDGNDGSAERITVYQYPGNTDDTDERVTWQIYRSVSTSSNVWRLGYVYKYINNVNTKLNRQSEWECALSVNNSGFLGGYIHGYESDPEIHVFLDNVEVQQADIPRTTPFDVLRIVTTSNIYYDGAVLCHHGKEYVFKDGMLTVKQSLQWLQNVTINNCFLAMLPPLKTVASKYYYDGSFAQTAFPTTADYTIELPEMRECYVYGDGVTLRAGRRRYPNVSQRRTPYVTDHNTNYNKFYFPACQNTPVTNGDVWTSVSYFEVK